MLGQQTGSRDDLKRAQQYFQLVGASASECDTIPGRQCMASCFFLLKQFEDVNIYLSSVKAYMYNDDDFNYNYGISLGAVGNFKEAEESLLLVANEKVHEYVVHSCTCAPSNTKHTVEWSVALAEMLHSQRAGWAVPLGSHTHGFVVVWSRAYTSLPYSLSPGARRLAC